MSKLLKAVAFMCFIYDVHFKLLAEKHECTVKEDLNGKVAFVPAGPHNNRQRGQNDDDLKYDMLGSNITKEMVKGLPYVMKRGVNGHIFCSGRHFAL